MSYLTTSRGRQIFYLQRGPTSGLPLLFVHGAAGHATLWGQVLRMLPDANCIILDLPGHGRSEGPSCRTVPANSAAVEELLDVLHLPPAVLIGHSLGGAIVLDLALRRPELIRALVLISASGYLPIEPALLQQVLADAGRARQWMVEASYGPAAAPATIELALQRLAEVPDAVLLDDIQAGASYDPRARLAEIRRPTLVLCGTEDHLTPLSAVRALAQRIPHARFEPVQGAGHLLPVEQPVAVASAIMDLLHSLR